MSPSDTLTVGSRPPIAEPIKQAIAEAFKTVPYGKCGALLVIVDEHGARMHLAAKIGERWKVGGIVGKPWDDKKPFGAFGAVFIEAIW